jgi:uncharacterized protein (TIGR02599 family)
MIMKMKTYMPGARSRCRRLWADGSGASPAFTLVELLVSMTFLVILMLVVTEAVGVVQRTWVRTSSRVSQFRESRQAFDLITNNLSQATLNTYWSANMTQVSTDTLGQAIQAPQGYQRQSELHFICGPTSQVLPAASGQNYPGHAVFFQAPLGVVNLVPNVDTTSSTSTNTANMSGLLCGRGYFVEWGSDVNFRPTFLNQAPYSGTVPQRFRMRLMEYSPTAEMNTIYATSSYRTNPTTMKQWYQDQVVGVMNQEVKQGTENSTNYGFTRPVAENILALIISPQLENTSTTSGTVSQSSYAIAPNYFYDSSLVGPLAGGSYAGAQGTQYMLPPMIQITMIALDERSGEFLSSASNSTIKDSVLQGLNALFQTATSYTADLEGTSASPGKLKSLLLGAKINYRIYTTTISLKQGRWSF